MYGLYERCGVFRFDLRMNAMAKVEYMTVTVTVARQDPCNLFLNDVG